MMARQRELLEHTIESLSGHERSDFVMPGDHMHELKAVVGAMILSPMPLTWHVKNKQKVLPVEKNYSSHKVQGFVNMD